jgi:3-hydroxyacyl-[acyl-carrier-protein] dehydratase
VWCGLCAPSAIAAQPSLGYPAPPFKEHALADVPAAPVMDIRRILSALPHRYPFLLVDRVVELVAGDRIWAYKNVTFNEGFFQGHFPGQPVMPGVLQLEAMAQAGALLAFELSKFDPEKKVIYLMAFDKVKFRRPVTPGDRLDLHVKLDRVKGPIFRLSGEAKVDGHLASECEMLATLADKPA